MTAAAPIVLLDDVRRRLFAFDPTTDPFEVLAAVAWTHPNGVSTCGYDCPTTSGGYCLDCHSTAASSLSAARSRFPGH